MNQNNVSSTQVGSYNNRIASVLHVGKNAEGVR